MDPLREFIVYAVKIHEKTRWPTIILKDRLNGKYIAISINKIDALSTLISLKPDIYAPFPRPLAQDLFIALASAVGSKIQMVIIDHLTKAGIFTAKIKISRETGENYIELDARPSDAIALALRTHTPIRVAPEVVSGISPFSPDAPPYREASFEELSSP